MIEPQAGPETANDTDKGLSPYRIRQTNDGAPMFLADLIDAADTCGGCLNGMFDVQLPTESPS
jgi:hypothetical protein